MAFPINDSDLNRSLSPLSPAEPNKDWGLGSMVGLIAATLIFAGGIVYASGYLSFRTASIFDAPAISTGGW
jgi:hypothetical protein